MVAASGRRRCIAGTEIFFRNEWWGRAEIGHWEAMPIREYQEKITKRMPFLRIFSQFLRIKSHSFRTKNRIYFAPTAHNAPR